MIDRLLTTADVAELTGFAPATVQDWVQRGELVSIKIGGKHRFPPENVEAFLESKRSGSSAAPLEVVQ